MVATLNCLIQGANAIDITCDLHHSFATLHVEISGVTHKLNSQCELRNKFIARR